MYVDFLGFCESIHFILNCFSYFGAIFGLLKRLVTLLALDDFDAQVTNGVPALL